MTKIKLLFLIYDLKGGGAEKVLINLLKKIDYTKFDITLLSIFGIGHNMSDIPQQVKFKTLFNISFRGFNTFMKLFSPKFLHKLIIKDYYDIEIAYLETSPTRIISGCTNPNTKKVAWVHIEIDNINEFLIAYRNRTEAINSYKKFDKIIFVAKTAKKSFELNLPELNYIPKDVIYNVNDIDYIRQKALEKIDIKLDSNKINICSVGRICGQKGYDRLLKVVKMLHDENLSNKIMLYLIGEGAELNKLKQYVDDNKLNEYVSFLGYKTNPYKYVSRMSLFICSSIKEGYSTAVTESIILGVPVLTTLNSGMNEILNNGKYGLITPNDIISLYQGLKSIIQNPSLLDLYAQNISQMPQLSTSDYVERYELFFDKLTSE